MTLVEAERLAAAKGLGLPVREDFSLAEVYGGDDALWRSDSVRKIGFG